MEISKALKELENVNQKDSNHKLFTMYLNTDPSDPEQQGEKWKINLKNAFRNFESYVSKTANEQELKSFKRLKEKVNHFVRENEQNLRRGIILFATADETIWFAELVQMRVTTEMYWQDTPATDQLKQLEEAFPYTGVVLVQKDQVKVMETHLNEVQEKYYYELDVETDDWREKAGPQPSHVPKGQGTANVQVDNFKERYKANQHRWYKSIAKKVDKLAKNKQWEKTYVIGESDYSSEMKKQMDIKINKIIQKNMLDHKEDEILKEIAG
ncbi:VLRF1 family aeRF1-type release factor [Virgibacillus sp. W0430]|uniref:VLRF1 family aeRF1-type release factor n=1 Tax=Virgibacillus sp. W0430 TaxID=3391580 RepID=UPI003F473B16